MPAASKKRPQGIGAKYASKKAKTTAPKYSSKGKSYGKQVVDWQEAMRISEAAVNRAINKNIETQVSKGLLLSTLGQAKTETEGWNIRNMNVSWENGAPKYRRDGAIIFNLGFLSQHGASLIGGFRTGSKINAKYLRVTIEATLPQTSADCTYHFRIVRRKADQSQQMAYPVPTISSMRDLRLFKTEFDGPFASSVAYGVGADVVNPFPSASSVSRQNTDEWRFFTGDAYKTKFVKGTIAAPNVVTGYHVSHFVETVYLKLEEEWDFPARPPNSELKGGNYFFVMWREGALDACHMQTDADVLKGLGGVEMKGLFELSYKDG